MFSLIHLLSVRLLKIRAQREGMWSCQVGEEVGCYLSRWGKITADFVQCAGHVLDFLSINGNSRYVPRRLFPKCLRHRKRLKVLRQKGTPQTRHGTPMPQPSERWGKATSASSWPLSLNLLCPAFHRSPSSPPTSPLAKDTQDPASVTYFAVYLALNGSRKTNAINNLGTKERRALPSRSATHTHTGQTREVTLRGNLSRARRAGSNSCC